MKSFTFTRPFFFASKEQGKQKQSCGYRRIKMQLPGFLAKIPTPLLIGAVVIAVAVLVAPRKKKDPMVELAELQLALVQCKDDAARMKICARIGEIVRSTAPRAS